METRQKMSKSLKGRNSPMLGKKLSLEHKEKIAASKRGKGRPRWIIKKMAEERQKIFCGSGNPRARIWIVFDTISNSREVITDLVNFCKLKQLNYHGLYDSFSRKKLYKKRWRLELKDYSSVEDDSSEILKSL